MFPMLSFNCYHCMDIAVTLGEGYLCPGLFFPSFHLLSPNDEGGGIGCLELVCFNYYGGFRCGFRKLFESTSLS